MERKNLGNHEVKQREVGVYKRFSEVKVHMAIKGETLVNWKGKFWDIKK
jgi:hypothetical protein